MKLTVSGLIRKALSFAIAGIAVALAPAISASAQTVGARPCDLYAAATPCVAAISTTRALYSSYTGPLYQVTRVNDNKSGGQAGLSPPGATAG
jgi:hypothetical protein